MMSDYDTQLQVEDQYDSEQDPRGTFKGEPASEDGWPQVKEDYEWDDMGLTPQEQFDILFGYAEERHIERGRRH